MERTFYIGRLRIRLHFDCYVGCLVGALYDDAGLSMICGPFGVELRWLPNRPRWAA